ncbi:MAG: hypothetical protein WD066_12895 [Planctomycetaceae bacterium]
MDDRRRRFLACLAAAGMLAFAQSGCALFVMAGKMFFGDPVMTPVFEQRTKVNLAKSDKTVLVVCEVPQLVKLETPTVDRDLMDIVDQRLRLHGIQPMKRDEANGWLDDNGGSWGRPDDIAAHCDADYIVVIDFETFSFRDRNSPGLLQGKASGVMRAYEVVDEGGTKFARELFEEGLESQYPEHNPVSHDQISKRAFQQKFVDRLGKQLGRMLHPHLYSETME